MIANTLIQSGKSLREEHDALSFVDRVQNQAEINNDEYESNFSHKTVAVLTRNFGMSNLDDNLIYKTEGLCKKVIYPTRSDLS